jgi:rhodanese-related sulfurtransferase
MSSTMTSPQLSTIDVDALRDLVSGDTAPRLIDVRSPQEFRAAHIPGSVNMPLEAVRQHAAEIGNHVGEDEVFICRSGQRAEEARRLLGETGARVGRVLDGGLAAWQRAGAPVRKGRSVWGLERQVRLAVGCIVLSSVVGSVALPRLKWVAAGAATGLTFAALTELCLLERVLLRLPFNRTEPLDTRAVISRLAEKS